MELTVIILAGGKSSRMGVDKGLLEVNGKTMVGRLITIAEQVSNRIMIIANQPGYENLGHPVLQDIYKNKGPAGGIHTGLANSQTKLNLVLGCDMPFLTHQLLTFLIDQTENAYDVCVPRWHERVQPLCAIYDRGLEASFEKAIQKGQLKMKKLIDDFNTSFVEIIPGMEVYTDNLFDNINTREEFHESSKEL